jgi:hypothetical protein
MARRWYSYGPDVSSWIQANCALPSGEHIGRPFGLMPWQKDWINELYACDAKGSLRYRWSLLGIPKKNSKPTMTAVLALYHLGEEKNSGSLFRWFQAPAGADYREHGSAAPPPLRTHHLNPYTNTRIPFGLSPLYEHRDMR